MTTTFEEYDEVSQMQLLDNFVQQFKDSPDSGEREWMKVTHPEVSAKPFLVKNLLSKEECEFLMNRVEYKEDLQWKDRDGADTNEMYRKNLRTQINHEDFTDFMYSRIKPYLPETVVVPKGVQELGALSEGTWHLQGLNSSVRFCKYTAGGVFKPHYDGLYMTGVDDRSLITLMFYLNGDLDGGSTNFLEDPDPSNPSKKPAVFQEVAPSQGLCICFPHNLYHEGQQLLSGEKFILRTDVMYHRESPSKSPSEQSKLDEADALMRLAQDFERSKQPEEAVKCYKRAFKLNPDLGYL